MANKRHEFTAITLATLVQPVDGPRWNTLARHAHTTAADISDSGGSE